MLMEVLSRKSMAISCNDIYMCDINLFRVGVVSF
jgi:hypothetical protein